MGYTTHHAVIIAHYRPLTVAAIHTYANATGAAVTEILPWAINGGASFAVLPDGSQDGWTDSKHGDRERAAIIAYARKLGAEFVEVSFGRESGGPEIELHSEDGRVASMPDEPIIAYTIGHEAGYDEAMEAKYPHPVLKLGASDGQRHPTCQNPPPPGYLGGCVWRDLDLAITAAERGVVLLETGARASAGVYEIVLLGTWEESVRQTENGPALFHDAPVLRKVWPE